MTNEEALKFIQEKVNSNNVVLFMKGTPDFPMCGFSGRVVQILNTLGAKFEGVNILDDENLRSAIKQYSNWPTIPQLYIKQEFVGGCDIATEMAQSGELGKLLKEKGIV
jgi:monothiol glutaredoxin